MLSCIQSLSLCAILVSGGLNQGQKKRAAERRGTSSHGVGEKNVSLFGSAKRDTKHTKEIPAVAVVAKKIARNTQRY
jgi:hypothetical protein